MRCSSRPFPAAGSPFPLPGGPWLPATLSALPLPRPLRPTSRRDAPLPLAGLFGKRTPGAAAERRLGHAHVLHHEDQQLLSVKGMNCAASRRSEKRRASTLSTVVVSC